MSVEGHFIKIAILFSLVCTSSLHTTILASLSAAGSAHYKSNVRGSNKAGQRSDNIGCLAFCIALAFGRVLRYHFRRLLVGLVPIFELLLAFAELDLCLKVSCSGGSCWGQLSVLPPSWDCPGES